MVEILFVAALQTVSLNKVFELFKPEQIRELIGSSDINDEKTTDYDPLLGLKIIQIKNNIAKINYSSNTSPILTNIETQRIQKILKTEGIDDLIITNLSIEIKLDPNDFKSNGDETNYIGEFRNEKCPNSESIREDLKEKNEKLYSTNKQFRYRQLILNYLIGKSQIGTVHRNLQKPLIRLKPKWQRNWEPVFQTKNMTSSQMIDNIQDVLGDYCVKENFKLSKKKEWELIGYSY